MQFCKGESIGMLFLICKNRAMVGITTGLGLGTYIALCP